LGNVIPFIAGEEDKIEREAQKILGSLRDNTIYPASFVVSSQANRVPVDEGHLECVSIRLSRKASAEEITRCWQEFRGTAQELELPSAPERPVVVFSEKDRPQPRLDVWKYDGMCSLVGRVRSCPVLDIEYVVLGHNTLRGAAGASVLNAELAIKRRMLD
jgi:aspartate-semialdehyde dehydrogenase